MHLLCFTFFTNNIESCISYFIMGACSGCYTKEPKTEPAMKQEPEPLLSETTNSLTLPLSGSCEIHSTDIMENEIVVCGIPLKETKKITKIQGSQGFWQQCRRFVYKNGQINSLNHPAIKEVLIHSRIIGNREYKVTNVTINGRLVDVMVDTTFHMDANRSGQCRAMNEDEILDFRRQWGKLWILICNETMNYNLRNSTFPVFNIVLYPRSWYPDERYPSVAELGGSKMEGLRTGCSRMVDSKTAGSRREGSNMKNGNFLEWYNNSRIKMGSRLLGYGYGSIMRENEKWITNES